MWRNKLAFHALSNGDLLAIDIRNGSVVYLDHDEGPMHGRRLGKSFTSFVGLFTTLGCPGPESWELEPFLGAAGLTVGSVSATEWINWVCGPVQEAIGAPRGSRHIGRNDCEPYRAIAP